MAVYQKPKDNIRVETKEEYVYVVEGWAKKYQAANAGFGIVIAIMIIALFGICYKFQLNYREIKA